MRAPDQKAALEELKQRFKAVKAAGIVTPDDLQYLWPRDAVVPYGNGGYVGRLSHCPVARRFPSDAIAPVEYELSPLQSAAPPPTVQAPAAPSPEAPPTAPACPPGMCG